MDPKLPTYALFRLGAESAAMYDDPAAFFEDLKHLAQAQRDALGASNGDPDHDPAKLAEHLETDAEIARSVYEDVTSKMDEETTRELRFLLGRVGAALCSHIALEIATHDTDAARASIVRDWQRSGAEAQNRKARSEVEKRRALLRFYARKTNTTGQTREEYLLRKLKEARCKEISDRTLRRDLKALNL